VPRDFEVGQIVVCVNPEGTDLSADVPYVVVDALGNFVEVRRPDGTRTWEWGPRFEAANAKPASKAGLHEIAMAELRDLAQPAWWKKRAPAPIEPVEPGELPDITVPPAGNDQDGSDSPTRLYLASCALMSPCG
jgi:hypothetical protein